jgi:hypothetical protein
MARKDVHEALLLAFKWHTAALPASGMAELHRARPAVQEALKFEGVQTNRRMRLVIGTPCGYS